MKKLMFITIILLQILTYSQFAGGTGSELDPFQVATADHLNNVRNYLDSCFIQTADINLGIAPWNVGEGWEPIGYDYTNSFKGIYDGNNYLIENLLIDKKDSINVGLFGRTQSANIVRVELVSVNILGYINVGALLGRNIQSVIENCSVTGQINGSNYNVGGFVGNNYDNSSIINCYSLCKVIGSSYVGGLAGNNSSDSYILNSYSQGNIQAENTVGGLVGANNESKIENCFASGGVTATSSCVGGLIGYNTKTITYGADFEMSALNSYSNCSVNGEVDEKGGLIGDNHVILLPPKNYTDNLIYDKNKESKDDAETTVLNSCWDMITSGMATSAAGEGRTTDEMTYPYANDTFFDWDFDSVWTYDILNTNNGYPYFQWQLPKEAPSAPENFIATPYPDGDYGVDLAWINPVNMINGDPLIELSAIYLYRDSVLIYSVSDPIIGDTLNFTDIPTIANYYDYAVVGENSYGYGIIALRNNIMVGLFAGGDGTETFPYEIATAEQLNNVRKYKSSYYLQIADIDLGVSPWNVGEGWEPIGDGTVPFSGNYDGAEYIIYNLTINRNSSNSVGFWGYSTDALISNMFLQNANVIGNENTGGLVGSNNRTSIENCYVLGEVSGSNNTGGLIGYNFRANITESYTDCDVIGSENTGGFIGLNYNLSNINNSYSMGNVTCHSDNAGGFAGSNNSSTIENNYSTGTVNCSGSNIGGFVGIESGDGVTGCYWDTERSGQLTSDGGEGRTTAEMTIPHAGNTFIGWDFSTIWGNDDNSLNQGYPILQLTTGIIDNGQLTIDNYELDQNYPNPFNPSTTIEFSIQNSSQINLTVYNSNGQFISDVVNGVVNAGMHSATFNALNLNSGIYYYRLKIDGIVKETKKMLYLR